MRIENTWCEDCGEVHFVEVSERNTKGLVTKTKCHGKEFLPTSTNLSINNANYYVRHRLNGYDVKQKMKSKPRTKYPTTFKRERPAPTPAPIQPIASRDCLAEISVNIRGQFVTIRVFADATPEKFYEFFYEVGDKPTMIKPRNLGKEKSVHISDIPRIFNIEGSGKPIFHKRAEYERLLTSDSASLILEKNIKAISSIAKQ